MKLFLILLPIILTFIYKALDFFNVIDKLSGRNYLQSSYESLSKPYGYPKSWLDKKTKPKYFSSIIRILKRYSTDRTFRNLCLSNINPEVITVSGLPTIIDGVPDNYPQERKSFYSESATIILIYNSSPHGDLEKDGKGKALPICSLGDLKSYLDKDKRKREFYINTILIGLVFTSLIRIFLYFT